MSTRPTLTREDWIQAAQRMLILGGIDTVRVDNLAKELKITRGSFYYHFKSRDELLQSLLTDWRARSTENVIRQLGSQQYSPTERLQQLLNLPFKGNTAREAAAFEIGIRAWARRDPLVRQAMDEVDSHRLHYIASILLQIGYSEEKAHDTAFLIYSYQLSLALIQPGQPSADRYEQHLRIIRQWLPQTSKN